MCNPTEWDAGRAGRAERAETRGHFNVASRRRKVSLVFSGTAPTWRSPDQERAEAVVELGSKASRYRTRANGLAKCSFWQGPASLRGTTDSTAVIRSFSFSPAPRELLRLRYVPSDSSPDARYSSRARRLVPDSSEALNTQPGAVHLSGYQFSRIEGNRNLAELLKNFGKSINVAEICSETFENSE